VTTGAADASRGSIRRRGDNIMNIAVNSGGNAGSLPQHEEKHEMTKHRIVDSSFAAIINAPIEKIVI
jgi:hypothetical protein